jgi:hypothetical protein
MSLASGLAARTVNEKQSTPHAVAIITNVRRTMRIPFLVAIFFRLVFLLQLCDPAKFMWRSPHRWSADR